MNAMTRPLPRLTAVGSGKGGTGKTLLALHLAHAFAKEGERVLLCDADLGLSNTTVHLGLKDGGDLPAVIAGDCEIDDVAVAVLDGPGKGGFDLLSAPPGSGAFANAGIAAAMKLIAKLRAAPNYDRVVLDLGAGVDATMMAMAAAADETIVVLTPDPAALTDAYAFTKLLLRATRFRAPEFIVNMVANDAEARRTAEAFIGTCRAFLKIEPPLVATVARDNRVLEAVRRQSCLSSSQPTLVARAMADAAASLHRRLFPSRVAAGGAR